MDGPMEALIPIFGMIFTLGIPGIIVFWYIYTRHRERMRLIEKGLPPEDIKNYFATKEIKQKNPYSALKFGIILLFLGIGIATANILEETLDFGEGISFGIILLSAGLGFLTYFIAVKDKYKNGNNVSNSARSTVTTARFEQLKEE